MMLLPLAQGLWTWIEKRKALRKRVSETLNRLAARDLKDQRVNVEIDSHEVLLLVQ